MERGKIFENVEFFQETRKILPSFKEIHKDRYVFIYTYHFEVFHVRCHVRMYLVIVFRKGQYESKYGSKYLDYSVFFAFFILSDLDPYLLSFYIYLQSASKDSRCGLFLYRVYEEYRINLCKCLMYCYCYIPSALT